MRKNLKGDRNMKNIDKLSNTRADRIKKVRKSTGLTQVNFGETIGASRDRIANLEKKNRIKKIDTVLIAHMCKIHNIKPSYIEPGIGNMHVSIEKKDKYDALLNDFPSPLNGVLTEIFNVSETEKNVLNSLVMRIINKEVSAYKTELNQKFKTRVTAGIRKVLDADIQIHPYAAHDGNSGNEDLGDLEKIALKIEETDI